MSTQTHSLLSNRAENFVSNNWFKPGSGKVKNPLRTRVISLALPIIAIADFSYHKSQGAIKSLSARFTKDPIISQKKQNIASSHFSAAREAKENLYDSLSLLKERLFISPASGYEGTTDSSDSVVNVISDSLDSRLESFHLRGLKYGLHQVTVNRKTNEVQLNTLNQKKEEISNLKAQIQERKDSYNGWLNLIPLTPSQWNNQRVEIQRLEAQLQESLQDLNTNFQLTEDELNPKILTLTKTVENLKAREKELEHAITHYPRTPYNSPVPSPGGKTPNLGTSEEIDLASKLEAAVSATFPLESMLKDISREAGHQTATLLEKIFQHKDVLKHWSFDKSTGRFEIELTEQLQVKMYDPTAAEGPDRPDSVLVLGKTAAGKTLVSGSLDKKGAICFDSEQVAGYGRALGKYQSAFLDKLRYDAKKDRIAFKKNWAPEFPVPFTDMVQALDAGSAVDGDPMAILTS